MRTGLTRIFVTGIIFLLMTILYYGCIKEKFDSAHLDTSLDLKPGLAIPIGYSHIVIEKYLSEERVKEILKESKDGFLTLYYSTPVDSGVMQDLVTLNSATGNLLLTNQTGSVISLTIPGSTFDVTDSLIIPISSPDVTARIDSIKLLTGTFQMNVTSSGLTGTITYQINSLRQNGMPVIITRGLDNPGFSLAIANYSLIPWHDPSGANQIKCLVSVHLQSPSGPIGPGNTIIDLQASLANPGYETLYGDFGGYTIDFPAATISTSFFRHLTSGSIVFADPKFKLLFFNSIGVPFGISFSSLYAIEQNGTHFPLTGSGVPTATDPKIIAYPSVGQSGQTISDSLVLDKDNSNLPSFIAVNPDSITLKSSVKIITLSPPANTFINHDSKYKVTAAVELPLWGKGSCMFFLDTMTFDYLKSAVPPPDELEKLIVRTSITNSFPVTVYPQVYLLNANRVLIDSLFTGTEKIQGATDINGDGKADPEKVAPVDVELSRSRMDNLLNTRYILIKSRIMTTEFPAIDVKIYSTYYLDYNVGIIAQLKIRTGK